MASRSRQPAVDTAVVDEFVTASRALVAIAVRSIQHAAVPVTVSQHRVLVLLAGRGDLSVGDIAELSGVNQSSASRLCDRLEKLELVRRDRSAGDGRVVRVSLNPAGKRVLDSVTAQRRTELERVLAHLHPDQQRRVVESLHVFNEAAHEIGDRDWFHTAW